MTERAMLRIPIATAAPKRPDDIELWALDRAIDILATAHGRPYAEAVKDIALSLMLTRAEGMRDGFKKSIEVAGGKAS